MFIIESVFIQNFMGFREATLRFVDYNGITLIEGANGSGKSAILEAVTWCMFNSLLRPTKRAKADEVMNRFCDVGDRTVVVTNLKIDGKAVVVERSRSRSGPNFKVSTIRGEGTGGGIQETFENILGMDYRTFTSSVIFGGGMSAFCSMSSADRNEIFEELLGLKFYENAQSSASKDKSALGNEVEAGSLRERNLKDRIEEFTEMLGDAKRRSEEFNEKYVERIQTLVDDNDDSFCDLEDSYANYDAARKKYSTEKDEAQKVYVVWKESSVKTNSRYDRVLEKVNVLREKKAAAQAITERDKKSLEDSVNEKNPSICPTCGQRWPSKDREALEALTNERRKAWRESAEKLSKILIDFETEDANRRTVLAQVSESAGKEPETMENFKTYVAPFRLKTRECRSDHESTLRILKAARKEGNNPHIEQIEDMKTKIAKVKENVMETRELGKESERALFISEFWSKAFGRRGLPSYLIDASIPVLNESAEAISKILTDDALYVQFDPAAAKGAGTVFSVEVEFGDGGSTYDMTSRGEHSRIDLTVLFSIRELIESRGMNTCGQVFIDELFDGLDSEGVQACVNLLRKRYENLNVFVISHDPELKGYCDNRIKVEKHRGESRIVA